MTPRQTSPSRHQTGLLGEQIVARWLEGRGYTIAFRRWRCRWGELDLIAIAPNATVVFVEVKTRKSGNWDNNGWLAISATKQQKLTRTARQFLGEYPHLAERPCRFDVALVVRQESTDLRRKAAPSKKGDPKFTPLGATLYHYAIAAFEPVD